MDPVVISFFTKNTFYESEAQNLIDSCKRFNLEYQIEAIESLGSWEYNCCYKPLFILKKLLTINKPLLWVDADGVIVQKPKMHDWSLFCDISLRIHESLPSNHPSKVCSGTIFCNNTKQTIEIIRLWKEDCKFRLLEKQEDMVWDQKCLRDVIYHKPHQARIQPLPLGYCQIYDKDTDQLPKKDVFIIHYQASRLYQKFIDREVVEFTELHKMSGKEIQNLRTGSPSTDS